MKYASESTGAFGMSPTKIWSKTIGFLCLSWRILPKELTLYLEGQVPSCISYRLLNFYFDSQTNFWIGNESTLLFFMSTHSFFHVPDISVTCTRHMPAFISRWGMQALWQHLPMVLNITIASISVEKNFKVDISYQR